ncbi:hypothetical protein EYC80_001772 [Monilinia laxa]|uniref:Uncharacterized protein n=1 Tax=Monilinia laxa TaxID=61186 RepID=A0A5N6K603_MONLA|nr:hypothetical protein EYC80_001772 [Monilinia laxa]
MSPPTYERRALSLKNFPLLNPRNNISPDAKIGEHVNLNEHRRFGEGVKPITIEPGCVVGASTNIKENVTLHANVHIGMNTEIGKNVDIGTGTKIARHVKIMESVHIGREAEIDYPSLFREHAWIGDNVVIRGFEIGVGVRIGDGVRVMSDVGDGTKVGKGTLIIYNATIGRNVVIGG